MDDATRDDFDRLNPVRAPETAAERLQRWLDGLAPGAAVVVSRPSGLGGQHHHGVVARRTMVGGGRIFVTYPEHSTGVEYAFDRGGYQVRKAERSYSPRDHLIEPTAEVVAGIARTRLESRVAALGRRLDNTRAMELLTDAELVQLEALLRKALGR